MQKTLGTAAPAATIILFIAVAVSSKATLVILASYGLLFLMLAPAVLLGYTRARWIKDSPKEKVPRAVNTMLFGYPAFLALFAVVMIIDPLHESGSLATEFTTFGPSQIIGVVGLVTTILLAFAVASRRQLRLYRKCPQCISRIPREASRCRYCTAEVDPASVTRKVSGQRGETGTALVAQRLPPRYATPGRKKEDFGQLSAPRVTRTGTRARSRSS